MELRKLGNSDLQLTPVGFGAWAIGGSGWEFAWGQQEDADSIAAIVRALELGVNWIDTAAVYGTGHSEEIVAQALKQWKVEAPSCFYKMRSSLGRQSQGLSGSFCSFDSQGMRRQLAPFTDRGNRPVPDALAAP